MCTFKYRSLTTDPRPKGAGSGNKVIWQHVHGISYDFTKENKEYYARYAESTIFTEVYADFKFQYILDQNLVLVS